MGSSSGEGRMLGLGWRAKLVREGVVEVCVGGRRVGGWGMEVEALKNRSSF